MRPEEQDQIKKHAEDFSCVSAAKDDPVKAEWARKLGGSMIGQKLLQRP